jgi:hypothetical protein
MTMTALTQALRLYLERSHSTWPRRNLQAVLSAFGSTQGPELLAKIDSLLEEANSLHPDWTVHSLQSATSWVETQMQIRHPNLEKEAIACLVDCF